MTNFARYIYEREGKQIIEDQNGFATFCYITDACYIEDIYVVPDKRKSGIAAGYADQIAAAAKSKGISRLLGSVKPSANGSTESTKVLLSYGFKLLSSTNDFIYFVKEL